VNPIYFGDSATSLFGVYHPPKAASGRATGVVLCYPFGQEYMRAHRAFRQLALLLTRAGFHVMRFDYYGTGDSAGDALAGSLRRWVADVGLAADELKDTAEIKRVSFVGLRLGAAVAALAAAGRDDVEHVVLWDPVVQGARYLEEVLADSTDSRGNTRRSVREDGTVGVTGFPIRPALREEIAELDLLAVGAPAGSRRLVVASKDREDYAELGRLALPGAAAWYQVVPSEGNWNEVDDYGGALIPVELIQTIVTYLARERQS
jgi:pimeloyl-ACP methyl ester carboxylesterase